MSRMKLMKLPARPVTAVISCLLLAPVLASAQEPLANPQDDRFRLSAGVFSATADTIVRLDADDGTEGTTLSAEDDLGYRDRSEVGKVEVELRLRGRHHMRFNYWRFDRNATVLLDQPIQFGNDVYVVNDEVNSSLDVRNFAATYAYDVLRYERFTLGFGLGVNLLEFRARAAVPARRVSEEESRTGPIPAASMQALVRISERFHLEARGEYMSVDVDDYEGSLLNLHAALLFRFTRNLGIGLGYTSLDNEVISRNPGDTGELTLKNAGGELFLRVAF